MYEQGVIRPPSEASSLLVRVTRNCPWNKCLFCPAYKGTTFSKRSVDEVKRDIDLMATEYGSHVGVITSAFLQDADSLVLPTPDLVAIVKHLKEKFPHIDRITTYARAKTLKRKTVDEYKELYRGGLNRIHTGLESGSEAVLTMIRKGSTPDDILIGGQRVMESCISLSEYIMPGVGGLTLSEEHALKTANLLNQIRPHFIRVRTFAMHPESPMMKMVEEGTFIPMSDAQVVREIRLLISNLDEMHSYFSCGDFSLNLLMQVDGYLNERKEEMLQELDAFLNLTDDQQKAYSLLRRSVPYMSYPIAVVQDAKVLDQVVPEIRKLEQYNSDHFTRHIQQLMSYQLPQPQTDNWV
jgi:radical SAM superfamily enzyme YgiQ (UPF0313 family)